jgi:hypothetical protein
MIFANKDQGNPPAVAQDALYVYCVARGDGSCLLGPIGLDGQMVYTVASGDIRAIVHNCPAQPYQSQDPQVLEGWVMAHQSVVFAATKAFGTVLPMAFDVIVRGGPGGGAIVALRGWLDEKRERFTQLLERLAGKAEYGVQVLWDRQAIAASLVQSDDELRKIQDEAREKPKGMAHLLQQKLAKGVRARMETQADLFAQDFYARIRRCVDDVRVEKLKKDDGGKQMLLNLSCLMPDGGKELGHVLDKIQETAGIRVRFTGPWPPYSFVGG